MPFGVVHPKSRYVLGCDLARMGEDETIFIVLEEPYGEEGNYYVVYIEATKHKKLNDAINRIIAMDRKFFFEAIYVDSTGLGAGVADVCREYLGTKVHDYTFTIQSKEDMYRNLHLLMERGKLKIPNHKRLTYQLLDLRYEMSKMGGHIKIHHSEKGHDDYPDALALAALHFKPGIGFTYIPSIG